MNIEHIQLLRGTAEALASVNPVLLAGELGLETDTGKFKFGDGTNAWNNLSYAGGGSYVPSANVSHETWTMTLDDDSVQTKEVVIWTSQG